MKSFKNVRASCVVILSFALSSPNHLAAQYDTNEKKAGFYLELCKKYCPDAYEILNSEEPEKYLIYAGKGESSRDLIRNFETVVHETCHGLNFKIGVAAAWNYDGYFISESCRIAARRENFFPSSVLNNVIPEEQQKKIFRYQTYVSGELKNSSSLQGVYGFLDEFCAYYQGSKAALELFPYFEKTCPYTDVHCWVRDYLSQMQSTLYAYYEFRLFIAWYLIYAEQHERKVFNELMNNQNMRLSFTLLENQFKQLLENYFIKRSQVIDHLNAAGNKIVLDKEFIRIVEGNFSSGTGIPDDEINYLKNLFTSKENDMLERFRVNGATLSNYKSFLEKPKR